MLQGRSSAAIARELGLSVKTVSTHRACIRARLGVRGPAELLAFALEHGLLQRGPAWPGPREGTD